MNEPAFQNGGPAGGAEYTIYVFDKPQGGAARACRWTRHCTLASLAQARLRAQALFRSGRYQKVEIKQKFFDKRLQRTIDVTLKVIEGGNGNRGRLMRVLSRLGRIFRRR